MSTEHFSFATFANAMQSSGIFQLIVFSIRLKWIVGSRSILSHFERSSMKFIIWLPDHTKELQNEFRTSLVNLLENGILIIFLMLFTVDLYFRWFNNELF